MTTQPTDPKKAARPAAPKTAPAPPAQPTPRLADEKQRILDEFASIMKIAPSDALDVALEIGIGPVRERVERYRRGRDDYDTSFRAETLSDLAASGVTLPGVSLLRTARDAARTPDRTSAAASGD